MLRGSSRSRACTTGSSVTVPPTVVCNSFFTIIGVIKNYHQLYILIV